MLPHPHSHLQRRRGLVESFLLGAPTRVKRTPPHTGQDRSPPTLAIPSATSAAAPYLPLPLPLLLAFLNSSFLWGLGCGTSSSLSQACVCIRGPGFEGLWVGEEELGTSSHWLQSQMLMSFFPPTAV